MTLVANSLLKVTANCNEMYKGSIEFHILAKAIWKSKAPTRACFLTSAATIGKFQHRICSEAENFKLASRRCKLHFPRGGFDWMNFFSSYRCPMCLVDEELANHLFVPCRWFPLHSTYPFHWWELVGLQPQTIKDVSVACRRRLRKSWILGVWKLLPLAIWWCTWRERKSRIFEGNSRSVQDFKLHFLRTLYSWSQVLGYGTQLTF